MARRAPSDPPPEAEAEALVSEGNPLRWRAFAPLVLATVLAVLLLASEVSPRLGVPLGALASLAVVLAILDFLGAFDDPAPRAVPLGALAPAAALTGAAVMALWGLLRAAVGGTIPVWLSAAAIPLVFLVAVAGGYLFLARLGPLARDEKDQPRPLPRRHGFWLVVLMTLLYLPMLGHHGLVDPWETHYGEVAREILARNDWISLWWAQDGWFWSKPVLSLWLQAAAMALLGVRFEPGEMMSAARAGLSPAPEWAVRFPVFLVTVVGVYLLYRGVARAVGRRPAFLGAVALVTMPQFFFIAHQTMTDMPLAAAVAGAVGLFAWAAATPPDLRARGYAIAFGRRTVSLSLFGLVMGAVLLVVVPQLLYLLSRNVSFSLSPLELGLGGDRFASGSPGNCGLPGNEACRDGLSAVIGGIEPATQVFAWIQVLALFAWLGWGERRVKRLLYLGAWLCASLATMSKGPAGMVLPALGALAFVIGSGRYRELAKMEIAAGLLLFATTTLPWFLAMYVRHGSPFVSRLLFHDMVERAFQHVHDTNEGDDTSFRYYLWQLGYASFPWVGFAPMALVSGLGRRFRLDRRRHETMLLLGGWFFAGFALFTFMGTKFHHYSLPIVAPIAMLVGLCLDRFLDDDDNPFLALSAIGAGALTFLVGRDFALEHPDRPSAIRLLHLFTYKYTRPWPEGLDFSAAFWIFAAAAALISLALAARRLRGQATVMLVAVATAFTLFCLDVYFVRVSPHWGQRELVLAYESRGERAPIIAYQLNWKGENFYLGNRVASFKTSGAPFEAFIEEQRRRGEGTFYFLTEHHRTRALRAELGNPERFDALTDTHLNNKFVLLRAEIPPLP